MAGGPLDTGVYCRARPTSGLKVRSALNRVLRNARRFTLKKLECLKQAVCACILLHGIME